VEPFTGGIRCNQDADGMLPRLGVEGQPTFLTAYDIGVCSRRFGCRACKDRDSAVRTIGAFNSCLMFLLKIASRIIVLREYNYACVIPFCGAIATFPKRRKVVTLVLANPINQSKDAAVGQTP